MKTIQSCRTELSNLRELLKENNFKEIERYADTATDEENIVLSEEIKKIQQIRQRYTEILLGILSNMRLIDHYKKRKENEEVGIQNTKEGAENLITRAFEELAKLEEAINKLNKDK